MRFLREEGGLSLRWLLRLDPIDRISHAGIIASFVALCGYAALLAATGIESGPRLWFCPCRSFFGIPCPTCGITRSLAAALRGDLGASLGFHPLGLPIAAVLAWLTWRCALAARSGVPFGVGRRGAMALLLLGVASWVLKFAAGAP